MAQAPCESSLRPDWLTVSFKSASEKHRQKIWQFAQQTVERVAPGLDWKTTLASRHFEDCFQHELGVRFETSPLDSDHMAGSTVINFQGAYFALSSVYEQMRLFEQLLKFKGRYHWTRLDAQVTTLNPSQSAEQIVKDVEEGRLWGKGFEIGGNGTGIGNHRLVVDQHWHLSLTRAAKDVDMTQARRHLHLAIAEPLGLKHHPHLQTKGGMTKLMQLQHGQHPPATSRLAIQDQR